MQPGLPQLKLPNKVLVVGLGQTGLSCVRFLHARGLEVAVTDSREQPPGLELLEQEYPDVAVFTGGFDPAVLAQAQLMVVSPGVPLSTPQIANAIDGGVPVVGDIELFAQVVRRPVAAITGSNGKSTVTTLLGEMAGAAGLKVAVGGNLGIPALDLLDESIDLYVLELSSFQLETTYSLAPAVAAVLNISPDHMDRYADLDHYAKVKAGIYRNAEMGVFNLDDPRVRAMAGDWEARFFSLSRPQSDHTHGLIEEGGESWLSRGEQRLLPAAEVKMPGRHNLANALAALAMGDVLGLPLPAMQQVLSRFPGLPHRVEYIATIDGVRWYNDSKATNPGASLAALQGLADGQQGKAVLIAGGLCKDADFSQLADALRQVRAVILMGRDKHCIRQALDASVTAVEAVDMQDAVLLAAELAQPGDRVLLSPACASFDMFDGFEHRGNVFREQVRRISA